MLSSLGKHQILVPLTLHVYHIQQQFNIRNGTGTLTHRLTDVGTGYQSDTQRDGILTMDHKLYEGVYDVTISGRNIQTLP